MIYILARVVKSGSTHRASFIQFLLRVWTGVRPCRLNGCWLGRVLPSTVTTGHSPKGTAA
jgi:hypothetical protein